MGAPLGLEKSQGKIVTIPVSVGELLDKLSILEVKREKIKSPEKRANVNREYYQLRSLYAGVLQDCKAPGRTSLAERYGELVSLNRSLWVVEDDIRSLELCSNFGELFIYLARQVYRLNDKRASIKRGINDASGSAIVEEKQYEKYEE